MPFDDAKTVSKQKPCKKDDSLCKCNVFAWIWKFSGRFTILVIYQRFIFDCVTEHKRSFIDYVYISHGLQIDC